MTLAFVYDRAFLAPRVQNRACAFSAERWRRNLSFYCTRHLPPRRP